MIINNDFVEQDTYDLIYNKGYAAGSLAVTTEIRDAIIDELCDELQDLILEDYCITLDRLPLVKELLKEKGKEDK